MNAECNRLQSLDNNTNPDFNDLIVSLNFSLNNQA